MSGVVFRRHQIPIGDAIVARNPRQVGNLLFLSQNKKDVPIISMMVLYFLLALIFLGTVWLLLQLGKFLNTLVKSQRQRANVAKQIALRLKEAEIEPGSHPDNPIPISTPSVVEAKASHTRCVYCDIEMRVDAHRAIEHKGSRLRVAELECIRCGRQRSTYFVLQQLN